MEKYRVTNSKGSYFCIMVKPTPVVLLNAVNILNRKHDNLEPLLVIEVKINDSAFVLINIYNANTKPEQLHTLQTF